MALPEAAEACIALAYRLALYLNSHLIDDPAMLALIFC